MIFVGDIAVPYNLMPEVKGIPETFQNQSLIANLEGAILDEGDVRNAGRSVYNAPQVLGFLNRLNVKLVSLANNHVLDLLPSTVPTTERLLSVGILSCGAGDSASEASRPVVLDCEDGKVVFLAFGWETIQCKAASVDMPGVNPLKPDHVLSSVKAAHEAYPDLPIILLMHWNYELELYPQPMHRQLAFAAVDAGANAVIGCHSHCVQGIEVYNEAPIVYGLGNWFLPEGRVFGRDIRFPDFALRELAFEWVPLSKRMQCHWFKYEREEEALVYESSETLAESKFVNELTPFASMSHKEYIAWFRKFRRKRILLPIYKNYNDQAGNRVKDLWVALRQVVLEKIQELGLSWSLR